MDYKDSLLMPKTDFEMRANLVEKEAKFHKKWEELKLYQTLAKRSGTSFILHDGPPFANGELHLGHALNKILKDITIRSRVLANYKIDWKLGWDTHGLPIETAIKKNNKQFSEKEIDRLEYIAMCKNYATEQIKIQKEQFMKMSLLTNFDDYYVTYDKEYEANQIEILAKMYQDKLIYHDLKPVYWSPSSVSALAEAEVEYQVKESNSIYVGFNLENDPKVKLVIWTTTPWTLPGNVAIAINDNEAYALYNSKVGKLIIAKKLEEKFSLKTKLSLSFEKELTIDDLLKLKYVHPLTNKLNPIVISNHVEVESGTGLVHIAPGHGVDDFNVAKKNKLEIFSVVDDLGKMINSKNYDTIFYEKANSLIIEDLNKMNSLLFFEIINHSYPHDWRTKKPIIFRATKQWFVSITKIKKNILSSIKKIDFYPNWGSQRLEEMIKNREDWCISRQRIWGVPIPIIYDENDNPINDQKIWERIIKLFREEGSIAWYKVSFKELLADKFDPKINYRKEFDIMDVWFDSGTSWKTLNGKQANLYLEGQDQYRGWFNSSITTSIAYQNQIPYKEVVTHGFVIDEDKQKMSKSIGNIISPKLIINTLGTDILRLWVSIVNYQVEASISDNIVKQVTETYRKLRNSLRFMIGNLFDFTIKDKINFNTLGIIDKEIINQFNNLIENIQNYYKQYEYWKIVPMINHFFTITLSNFYFDFSKDILYVEKANSKIRKDIQNVLFYILKWSLLLLAPILPTTVEEGYQFLKIDNKKESIFLETYFSIEKVESNFDLNAFFELRNLVNKELEKVRNNNLIKKSLEAELILELPKQYHQFINLHLKQLFIVSNVVVKKSEKLSIKIEKAKGNKCLRCWNINSSIINDLCDRCRDVINELRK